MLSQVSHQIAALRKHGCSVQRKEVSAAQSACNHEHSPKQNPQRMSMLELQRWYLAAGSHGSLCSHCKRHWCIRVPDRTLKSASEIVLNSPSITACAVQAGAGLPITHFELIFATVCAVDSILSLCLVLINQRRGQGNIMEPVSWTSNLSYSANDCKHMENQNFSCPTTHAVDRLAGPCSALSIPPACILNTGTICLSPSGSRWCSPDVKRSMRRAPVAGQPQSLTRDEDMHHDTAAASA